MVVIIALLAAVALPLYSSYLARSQASELVLKYDAIRTNVQVAAKTSDVQVACATLANTVHAANLRSDDAQLAVNFEPVSGGYTPVLTLCASLVNQGRHGVEVTREAHGLLSRNSAISPGAVIGDSAVSFSVKLAGDSALCTVPPPLGSAKAACGAASGPTHNGGGTTVVPMPGKSPASGASAPVGPASAPAVPASNPAATTQNGATRSTCTPGPAGSVNREVMRFSGSGHVVNSAQLNTQGDMSGFSAEVTITGSANNDPEATLMSYDTARAFTGFGLFAPQSLRVEIGPMAYNTGVNVEDGKTHRLTVSWQQAGGTLVLYDNGREVWRRQGVNSGGTVAGNGNLMIGEDDVSASWGPGTYVHGYTGSIVNVALSNQVASAAQVASGPLHSVFQASNGLVTDVVMGPDRRPRDLTGHTTYTSTGGVSAQIVGVDASVYRDRGCP